MTRLWCAIALLFSFSLIAHADGALPSMSLGVADHRGIFATGSTVAAPTMTATVYDNITGQLTLTWTASPGSGYSVEISQDLISWTQLGAPITATASTASSIIDAGSPPTTPASFYRIRLLP